MGKDERLYVHLNYDMSSGMHVSKSFDLVDWTLMTTGENDDMLTITGRVTPQREFDED